MTLLPGLLPPQGGGQVGPRAIDDIKTLIDQLNTNRKDIFDGAVEALGKAGKRAVIHMLPLVDDQEQTRQTHFGLMRAFAEMGPPAAPSIPKIAPYLKHEDPQYVLHALGIVESVGGAPARKLLPRVRELLSSDQPAARALSYQIIGHLDPDRPRVIQEYKKGLADHEHYQLNIAEAISKHFKPGEALPLVDLLLGLVGSPNHDLSSRVIRSIAGIGPKALPNIFAFLDKNQGIDARRGAFTSLGKVRPVQPEQVDRLIEELKANFAKPESGAIRTALREIAGPSGDKLGELLEMDSIGKELKLAVIQDLGTIGHVVGAQSKRMAKFLESDDVRTRRITATAFRVMGAKQAFPALLAALNDPDRVVKENTIAAISRLGDVAAPALPRFVEMLGGDARLGRLVQQAYTVLGKHGLPSAPGLLKLLGSDKADVRERAIQALAAMGPPVLPSVRDSLRSKVDARVARGLLQTLAIVGPRSRDGVELLIGFLKNENALLRRDAALALARVGPLAADAVPHLRPLLSDEDQEVRVAAITALGTVGRKSSILDTMLVGLKDGSELVRLATIEALGWKGHQAAVPKLIELLKHEDSFVRLKAIRALSAIGPAASAAEKELRRLQASDRAPYIAPEAARAITEITK